MGEEKTKQLVRLSERRDLAVSAGDPDVRGWWVFSSDGERVGRVHDLIVDLAAMKVAFLDVLLCAPGGVANGDHVLIAASGVRAHAPSRWVTVQSHTSADFARLPGRDRRSPVRMGARPRPRRILIGRGVRLAGGEHEPGPWSER